MVGLLIEPDMRPEGVIDPECMISAHHDQAVAVVLSAAASVHLHSVSDRLVNTNLLLLHVLSVRVGMRRFKDLLNAKVSAFLSRSG